jgi:hypothetical protein
MGIFDNAMIQLQSMGVLDVILPFILIFTIVFATLQKTKILGEDENKKPRKNFNAVIALVMGLAVVIPHVIGSYPSPDSDVVNIINNALPNVSVVLVAVIMLLLIIGVFGSKVDVAGSSLAGWAVIFAIIATLVIFANAANWFILPDWLNFLNDPETQSLIVVILVFAIIIWFVTKEDKPKDSTKPTTIQELGKILGGGGAK